MKSHFSASLAFGMFLIGLSLVTSASQAAAGTKDGGGGKVAVCKNSDGSVKSVELLDLWEARTIYARTLPVNHLAVADQVAAGIAALQNIFPDRALDNSLRPGGPAAKGELGTQLRFLAAAFLAVTDPRVNRIHGIDLYPTEDSFEEASPKGCEIKQIVVYKDGGMGGGFPVALVDQDLYDQMDATNQAALILHESLYAIARKVGDTNSIRTRRAVGLAMSGYSFASWDPVVSQRHIRCVADTTSPHAGKVRSETTQFHFISSGTSIYLVPEIIYDLQVAGLIGYEVPISGQSIEQFFSYITTPRTGNALYQVVNFATSMVDFDTPRALSFLNYANGENMIVDYGSSFGNGSVECKLVN